jgi:hypothetical protein
MWLRTKWERVYVMKKSIKILSLILSFVLVLTSFAGCGADEKTEEPETEKKTTTEKIGPSEGELSYYYFTTWYQFYQSALQYEQYMGQGAGLAYTGFDYSKSPEEQPLTADIVAMFGVTLEEIGNTENPTWADAITYSAINTYVSTTYGAEMARKNNITISAEDQTYLEGTIQELKTTAEQNEYTLDEWLGTQYGEGVTEEIIRTAMENEYLSAAYYRSLQEGITSDEIAKEYKISEILKEEKYKTAIDEQNQFIRNSLMPSS